MNKRQAKKRRKKQEQVCVDFEYFLKTTPELVNDIVDGMRNACKIIRDALDRIKAMPEDEFEKFCENADLQQIAFMRLIRMRGSEIIEQKESNP